MKFTVITAAAVSLTLAACGGAQNEQASVEVSVKSDSAAAERVAVSVETMQLQPELFKDVINVVGTVKPAEDVMVATEEGGKVARWYVGKGAFVRAGQPLVKLNDDLLRSQLDAAEAQYRIAKLNAEKSAQVFADAGAVSEVSVKTSEYTVDAQRANVELLKTRIAKTVINAPMSGRIEAKLVDVGEMAGPGSPVARLIQTGTVKVTAGVPERFVDGIRVGLPVEMTFDALSGRTVSGRITYVGVAISERDRTIPIEIELPNNGDYSAEMVVNVSIRKDELRNVIVVPRTAVVRVEDGYQVFVASPKGEQFFAEARPVTLGPADQGKVVVTTGLKPGERIITVGQAKVNPGEPVTF
jgi:multidrug efflux system membrane fusion protein